MAIEKNDTKGMDAKALRELKQVASAGIQVEWRDCKTFLEHGTQIAFCNSLSFLFVLAFRDIGLLS